jgi:hypothetical protein
VPQRLSSPHGKPGVARGAALILLVARIEREAAHARSFTTSAVLAAAGSESVSAAAVLRKKSFPHRRLLLLLARPVETHVAAPVQDILLHVHVEAAAVCLYVCWRQRLSDYLRFVSALYSAGVKG